MLVATHSIMTSFKGGSDLATSNAVWKSGMLNISESLVFFVEPADLFTSFELKYPGAHSVMHLSTKTASRKYSGAGGCFLLTRE